MKYAVLGAFGQLGRDLCPILMDTVFSLDRSKIDLAVPETITKCLDELQPDIVVNCAAYNLVDKAESDPQSAMQVNAWGLAELAKWCNKNDKYLVHYSSDYVFGLDQNRTAPFLESDKPGPVSNYGISKLAGEYVVSANCRNHLIIRTCGLYGVWGSGGKGGNFVETMLKVAAQGKPLKVVSDQFCTPTYTKDLAAVSASLIKTKAKGLLHLTNQQSCTWFDFAQAIFEISQSNASLSPINSKDFNAPARRPSYSVLNSARNSELGFPPMRTWKEALKDYLKERKTKPSLG